MGGGGRIAIYCCATDSAIPANTKTTGFENGSIYIPCSTGISCPVVEIRHPEDYTVVNTEPVRIDWYVNGYRQYYDTLANLMEGLNSIYRSYTNEQGSTGIDSVYVVLLTHNGMVYSGTDDLSRGSMQNLDTAGGNALRLSDKSEPFNVIWIAVSSKGTVVKIDTKTGQILGEYMTSPYGQPKNPSRTTVDRYGSVWVTNRDGNSVTKIGLVESGQCVDRNGDGVITTSIAKGDIHSWNNEGDADTYGGVSTAEDECITCYTRTTSLGTRHVSVTKDNNIWVSGTGGGQFDLIDGETGVIIRKEPSVGYGGYGGLIDTNGVIWSARPMLRWNTALPLIGPNGQNWRGYSHDSYGLCIDRKGYVWNTSVSEGIVRKFSPEGSLVGSYYHGNTYAQGCVADINDHIWVAHSLVGPQSSVGHLLNDGTYIGNVTVGKGPTGVAVDADGKIWVTNYNDSSIYRIDPLKGPVGRDGITRVGEVDLVIRNVGGNLYNYSDMTGSTLRGKPNVGFWDLVFDSRIENATWGEIAWLARVCTGASLTFTVSSSIDNVIYSTPVAVRNGGQFSVPDGRYLRVKARFSRSDDGQSPELFEFRLATLNHPFEPFVNFAPAVQAGIDRRIVLPRDSVELRGTVCDDGIEYGGVQVRWKGIDSNSAKVTFTDSTSPSTIAHFDSAGLYTLVLSACDGMLCGEDSMVVKVDSLNRPPVFTSMPVTSAREGDLYIYMATAEDPDPADVVRYAKTTGPASMKIGMLTGLVEWTPGDTDGGEHAIVITAYDEHGGSVNQEFMLCVDDIINVQPYIYSTPVTVGKEGSLYEYAVVAHDPDNDPLVYHLPVSPEGMTIDAAGIITWVPSEIQAGNHNVNLTVNDGRGGVAEQAFTIAVAESLNAAPVITSTPPLSGSENSPYTYTVLATDGDHDPLLFRLIKAPSGMTIDSVNGLIYWLPVKGQAGSYEVVINVQDGRGGSADQAFTLQISELPNTAPVILSLPVTSGKEEVQYSYDVEASDAEGDLLKYKLSIAPSEMTIDSLTGLISWLPRQGQAGSYEIRLTVTDERGMSSEQAFMLQIAPYNTPPQISSQPMLSAKVNSPYRYTVEAVDIDNDTLIYRLTTAPEGMSIDTVAGVVSWVAQLDQAGNHAVGISVDDGRGGISAQDFVITVLESLNTPPRFVSEPPTAAVMGEPYSYSLVVADDDGDALTITITTGPAGAVLNQQVNSWIPRREQIGSADFVVLLDDGYGGTAEQAFTVNVASGPNHSPVFMSTPEPTVLQDQQWRYQVVLADADSDPVQYMIQGAPAGMSVINGELIFTPGNDQVGTHSMAIIATDSYDTVKQEFSIEVINVNDPPAIASVPVTGAVIGADYVYAVIASDPDGDPLQYALYSAPAGMTIDQTGVIRWPAITGIPRTEHVEISVTDGNGGSSSQAWELNVINDTHAPSVDITFSSNPAAPGTQVLLTIYANDNVGVAELRLYRDGEQVAYDPTAGYSLSCADTGRILFRAEAVDAAGNVGFAERILVISTEVDETPPSVSIDITPSAPQVGQTVYFAVTASDNAAIDPERVWLNVDGVYVSLKNGAGTFVPLRKGTFKALATAYDVSGNYGEAQEFFTASISGSDTVRPVVRITGIQNDTVVTGILPITGTVSDINFGYYTISYAEVGSASYIETYRSAMQVIDGQLGAFDATLLQNGDYLVQVTAYDTYGNTSASAIRVRADGQKKIGAFTLAFEDLTVPLPGINLTAVRTYDSRVKERGDFGVGWRLDLRSIRLSENRIPGEGWSVNLVNPSSPLQGYEISTRGPHTISIDIPGGRTQVFDVVATFFNALDPTYGSIAFRPRPGTFSILAALDVGDFYVMGGELYDETGDFLEPYNPNRYRLTLPDGTAYIVDQDQGGVVAIIDLNGNQVTLSALGLNHSAGQGLRFSRDSQGRIVSIRAPDGAVLSYSYDGHGNLQRVTDANGNTTLYKYAPDHYLMEIIDPRGVRATRTEYDDDGRMVRQINPAGDTLYFDHDLANSTEYTTDFNGNTTAYTYDDRGNVLTKTDATGATWEYTYDALDNLLSTRNPDGTVTNSTYDSKGNELTSTDERGYTTTRTYNSRGQVLTETDALNRTTEYEYSSTGNLLRTIGPDGMVTSERTYAANGNVLTEKDGEGNLSSYEYDSQGRMVARVDALNRRTGYVLDARGQTMAEVDPDGDSTKYAFDNNGNQVMTVNALGDTTRSTYNVFDKVATQTDARGNITRFEYDLFGQLKKTVAADSTFTQRTYDGQGNVKTSTDELGRVTTFEYDHENRLAKTIFPDNSFTEVEYDSRGRRTASIDRNGNRTEYFYDNAGNNTVVRDALGNEIIYEYDQSNRRTALVDALGQRTEYLYDDHDRLVRTTFADGTSNTITYDNAGRKVAETDQEGNTTAFAYDSVGNLTSVTDAMGYVTSYAYDSNNNRISQTDANGHTTALAYDRLNRLVRRTYPNGDQEHFVFDPNGNQIGKVDGEGDSTVYTFDSRNREVLRRFTNSWHTVETRYTEDSKTDTVIDHHGMTIYTYDTQGRQSSVTNPDGSFIRSHYDSQGNRIAQVTPFDSVAYEYDPLNRMSMVTASSGTTQYVFNAVGNRDSVVNPNGATVGYEYDNLNRLTGVTNYGPGGSVISSYTYELNNAGIRTAVTEADGSRVDYTYDSTYKLTGETRTGTHAYEISYVYDPVGNRLTKIGSTGTTTYSYNNRDQLISESGPGGTVTQTYDHAGRLTGKTDAGGTTAYGWEDNDRMVSVSGPGVAVSYAYDHNGQRVSETTASGEKKYLIDYSLPYGQVVAEMDGSGNVVVGYVYGLERISQSRSGSTRFYLTDGQASTRQLTDDAGNATDQYWFEAFGGLLAKTGSTENHYLYAGEYLDGNSGYYNLRARLYNPEDGRFLSSDPFAGDPQAPVSLHRYLYAAACPVSFADPSGENFTLAGQLGVVSISGILSSIAVPTYIGVVAKVAAMAAVTYALNEVSRQLFEFAPVDAAAAGIVGTVICAKEFYSFWTSQEFKDTQRKKPNAKHYIDVWGPSLPNAPNKDTRIAEVNIHRVVTTFYIHGGGGRLFQLRYRIGPNASPGAGYFLYRADYMDYQGPTPTFSPHWHLRWDGITKDHVPF